MERSAIKLQTIVLVVGLVIMLVKFAAWRITSSTTILSDALESIVNVLAGGFALYSLVLAAKPRDREHPYGHGKVEYISAGVEGGAVIIAGAFIIYRSVRALLQDEGPVELEIGILLTAIAGAINFMLGSILRKRGVGTHSITMEASGEHLLSDAWSTVAMICGLVFMKLTSLLWLDQVFAIGFAIYIIFTGSRVFRRSVAGIMDEADNEAATGVIDLLQMERRPEWIDLHNFRMIKYGRILHIDCHVTLPWYFTLEAAHDQIAAMERIVNERSDREVEFFVHMDPCIPTSCAICALHECPVRRQPEQENVIWTLDTVLANEKHGFWGLDQSADGIGDADRP